MTKVLVIEDDLVLREQISEILMFNGYEVDSASGGISGVQRAIRTTPDLILCDIMMPDLDGYGVLKEVRKNADTAATPFLFLTALSSRHNIRQGMEGGADDYLTKPFTEDELLNAVQSLFKKRSHVEEEYQKRIETLRTAISRTLPHELRTPLVSIVAYSEMMQRNPDFFTTEEVRSTGEVIYSSSKRLQHLIENYLLYSRLLLLSQDARQVQMIRSEKIDNASTIVQDVAIQQADLAKRADDLEVETHPGMVRVIGSHLTSLMMEVCSNAFKFSLAGSKVKVSSGIDQSAYIIRVRNEGRGMTREEIKGVSAFTQFERRIYEQQGAGLGLAICQIIMEIHHGEILIHSDENTYLEVEMVLPLA